VGQGDPGQVRPVVAAILGSVGEPINPEAYVWYRENIGGDRTPVMDTWWQTETGAHMISPLPGVTAGKPGSAMKGCPASSSTWWTTRGRRCRRLRRLPGRQGAVAGDAAHPVGRRPALQGHVLVALPGMYFAGDGAKKDD
jgi:acetyl-CoA synthetase